LLQFYLYLGQHALAMIESFYGALEIVGFIIIIIIITRRLLTIDPCVDGLKRLRLTPKLFDWLVDASQFFRRRRRSRLRFSTAIATQLI